MSVICQNFVQNAWRKDLCSNCFKSVSDHGGGDSGQRSGVDRLTSSRYIPQAASLYQARGLVSNIHWRALLGDHTSRLAEAVNGEKISCREFSPSLNNYHNSMNCLSRSATDTELSRGILKSSPSFRRPERNSVGFAEEEPLVIGYGGNDYDSDDSPWDVTSDDGSVNLDAFDVTEEDRVITKITKENTEFNSVNENLIRNGIIRKDKTETCSMKEEIFKNDLNTQRQESVTEVNFREKGDKNVVNGKVHRSDTKSDHFFPVKDEVQTFPDSRTSIRNYLTCNGKSDYRTTTAETEVSNNQRVVENNLKPNVNVESLNRKNNSSRSNNESMRVLCFRNSDYISNNISSESPIKINVNRNGEGSSDSDYFTSRHTAGESSTDSESFPDLEESSSSLIPCSSFLHNTAINSRPSADQSDSLANFSAAVEYETGSSSSGDVSTISDDSDSHFVSGRATKAKSHQGSHKLAKSSVSGNQSLKLLSPQSHSKTTTDVFKKSNAQTSRKQIDITEETVLASVRLVAEKNRAKQTEQHRRNKATEYNNWLPANDEWESVQFPTEKPQNFEPETAQTMEEEERSSSLTCGSVNSASDSNVKTESTQSSGDRKVSRQSKLAALALELEQARCDALSAVDTQPVVIPQNPLEISSPGMSLGSACMIQKARSYPSIVSTPTSRHCNNSAPRRASGIPSSVYGSRLSSLPDVLPDSPAKLKKGRFSLKKLLKRNTKDHEPVVVNSDHNLKAWKHQSFDRSRLSLEIVHPMDITSDPGSAPTTSTESTPTEENRHSLIFMDPSGKLSLSSKSSNTQSTPRACSLSVLPHLTSSSDIPQTVRQRDTASSLDRPKMDIGSLRKASTVAERNKKSKAPTRTPSCSALHGPSSAFSPSGSSIKSGACSQRPPKPPPPPRGKSFLPVSQTPKSGGGVPKNVVPARPPPPKLAEQKEANSPSNSLASSAATEQHYPQQSPQLTPVGDYANLGNIRSQITPKKPQRPSATITSKDSAEFGTENEAFKGTSTEDNAYEILEVTEEEDHYTYLDEAEAKANASQYASQSETQSSSPLYAVSECSTYYDEGASDLSSQLIPACSTGDEKPPERPPEDLQPPCPEISPSSKKPWLDLQASYAAIAAANYESLVELITTTLSEGAEQFQKTTITSLQWSDFDLESKSPMQILEDKIVYNAVYKSEPNTKVTLMVTTQKQHTSQSSRSPTRPPLLASFSDYLPRHCLTMGGHHSSHSDVTKAMIYVLQRAKATTVSQFALENTNSEVNQNIHLRDACFILLQLIHTLKNLQADGTEEIDYDLSRILLIHTDANKPPILVLLPGDKIYLTMTDFFKIDSSVQRTTLCQATLQLMLYLLRISNAKELESSVVKEEALGPQVAHTFAAVAKVLSEEKASSLSQAKGLLEYMLWGPVDVAASSTNSMDNMDVILQRWLDLQRAQMVKSLVSTLHLKINTPAGLHVYEEYQLLFLLQATVKSLKDVIAKL